MTKVQRKPKFRVGQVVRTILTQFIDTRKFQYRRITCVWPWGDTFGYTFPGGSAAYENEIKPLTKKEMGR